MPLLLICHLRSKALFAVVLLAAPSLVPRRLPSREGVVVLAPCCHLLVLCVSTIIATGIYLFFSHQTYYLSYKFKVPSYLSMFYLVTYFYTKNLFILSSLYISIKTTIIYTFIINGFHIISSIYCYLTTNTCYNPLFFNELILISVLAETLINALIIFIPMKSSIKIHA